MGFSGYSENILREWVDWGVFKVRGLEMEDLKALYGYGDLYDHCMGWKDMSVRQTLACMRYGTKNDRDGILKNYLYSLGSESCHGEHSIKVGSAGSQHQLSN
jgi:hypothetical protein